jgi:hypothetical protein
MITATVTAVIIATTAAIITTAIIPAAVIWISKPERDYRRPNHHGGRTICGSVRISRPI